HNNYIASGDRSASYAGAAVPDRSLTGGTEWTYGPRSGLGVGAHFPILTRMHGGATVFDGAALRALLINPGQHHFFYGLNVALDYGHWGPLTLAFNPSLFTGFDGVSGVVLAPSERMAYDVSRRWTLALEHYCEPGALGRLQSLPSTHQQLFA